MLLRERLDTMKWFVLGVAISGVISIFIFKPGSIIGLEQRLAHDLDYSYRILIDTTTTFIWAAVLFLYPRFRSLVVVILVVFALVSFSEGSRSAGAVTLLVVTLFVFRGVFFGTGGMRTMKRMSGWKLILLVAVVLITITSIAGGYQRAVLEGWFGGAERERYIAQSQTKIGIMIARKSIFSAIFAIEDSPILGHGSWASDKKGYRFMGDTLLGLNSSSEFRWQSISLIPGHSHLWGAWITHGFFGFAFWFYMFMFVIGFLVYDLPYIPKYLPFLLLIGLGSLWDIVFSPIGFRPLPAAAFSFMLILSEAVARARAEERKAKRANL